ncbi:Protein lin-52, partial [Galemys pyrenaicus]
GGEVRTDGDLGIGFLFRGVAYEHSFPADGWPRHVTWVGRWRLPRTVRGGLEIVHLEPPTLLPCELSLAAPFPSTSFPRMRLQRHRTDLEASLLSFEKLDRASPDLWPEQLPGVAEFAASFKSPITSSPPKWMAEIERDDIDMLKELGSLTTANLMEKVRGLQNLAYQLGLDE